MRWVMPMGEAAIWSNLDPMIATANAHYNSKMAKSRTGASTGKIVEANLLNYGSGILRTVGAILVGVGTGMMIAAGPAGWIPGAIVAGIGAAFNIIGNSIHANPQTGDRNFKLTEEGAYNSAIEISTAAATAGAVSYVSGAGAAASAGGTAGGSTGAATTTTISSTAANGTTVAVTTTTSTYSGITATTTSTVITSSTGAIVSSASSTSFALAAASSLSASSALAQAGGNAIGGYLKNTAKFDANGNYTGHYFDGRYGGEAASRGLLAGVSSYVGSEVGNAYGSQYGSAAGWATNHYGNGLIEYQKYAKYGVQGSSWEQWQNPTPGSWLSTMSDLYMSVGDVDDFGSKKHLADVIGGMGAAYVSRKKGTGLAGMQTAKNDIMTNYYYGEHGLDLFGNAGSAIAGGIGKIGRGIQSGWDSLRSGQGKYGSDNYIYTGTNEDGDRYYYNIEKKYYEIEGGGYAWPNGNQVFFAQPDKSSENGHKNPIYLPNMKGPNSEMDLRKPFHELLQEDKRFYRLKNGEVLDISHAEANYLGTKNLIQEIENQIKGGATSFEIKVNIYGDKPGILLDQIVQLKVDLEKRGIHSGMTIKDVAVQKLARDIMLTHSYYSEYNQFVIWGSDGSSFRNEDLKSNYIGAEIAIRELGHGLTRGAAQQNILSQIDPIVTTRKYDENQKKSFNYKYSGVAGDLYNHKPELQRPRYTSITGVSVIDFYGTLYLGKRNGSEVKVHKFKRKTSEKDTDFNLWSMLN